MGVVPVPEESMLMPLYVYGCPQGHRIEKTHGFNDEPVVMCPVCKSTMKRVPQLFSWGRKPFDVLVANMEKKQADYIRRKKARRVRNVQ